MIVITGASSGLGLQLAKIYQNAGTTVVNVARHESDYASVNIKCDLTKNADIESAASEIMASDEKLTALVNCAGVFSEEKLESISAKELDKVLDVNIRGAILLTSRLADRIKRDKADVVNIASTIGLKAYKDQASYGASKWAMRGFSANLKEEFEGLPNRIISFCPGGIATEIFEKATGNDPTDEGVWLDPAEVAKFIKQILDLPKEMEVSEVVINRKKT